MTSPTHRRPTALVTGGSKGIGLALAREFARNGYDLLLVARKKKALKEAATEIEHEIGVAVRTYAIDLAGPGAPEVLFHYAQEAGIHVDALINNAGLGAHGAFAQSDRSRTKAMLDLNIVSLTSLTHLFLNPMLARGEGQIINVASVVAYFAGGPQWAAYVASKAYVLSFSRGLAKELRGTGVTITALAPGSTATDFVADVGVGSTRVYRWLPKVSVERIARAAYRSAMKGRTTVVPGILNKVLAFLGELHPRSVALAVFSLLSRGGATLPSDVVVPRDVADEADHPEPGGRGERAALP